MAQVNVSIRMDSDVKKQAEELFEDLGMNISTAFNIFVKQALRTGSIPFKIAKSDRELKTGFYSEANQKYLAEQARLYNEGKLKTVVKTFAELEEMAK